MRLNLKELALQGDASQNRITLKERLPVHIHSPCTVDVSYRVEKQNNYYLIHMVTSGNLLITCQRCLGDATLPYHYETQLAVCSYEDQAEQLLSNYECIVADSGIVELEELVTDELHLYSEEFHPNFDQCDQAIQQYFQENRDTNE